MGNFRDRSVGEIVTDDYRAAQVFEDYKIDFCCNGRRLIQDVLKRKVLSYKL